MGTMDLWWLPNMFSAYFRYFLSYKPLIQLKSFLNFKVQVIDFRCRKWKYNVLARVASEPNSEWHDNRIRLMILHFFSLCYFWKTVVFLNNFQSLLFFKVNFLLAKASWFFLATKSNNFGTILIKSK